MTDSLFPGGTREDGLPRALDDPQRLAAVTATGLLDTGPELAFEDLAGLAAAVTGCSRAFITLVDDRRSFWKSCVGVDATRIEDRQNRVEDSFCYFLVGCDDTFAVDDAATDPRTRDHPSVGPMKIGAWAGCPIRSTAGDVLGSMCVIDESVHPWQPPELTALATLARAVSNEINLREALARSNESLQLSRALARSLQDSLLPPVLPGVPGLDVASAYRPASGGSAVTGDFYDLFPSSSRRWTAVIGDVCGTGIEAARLTALARYTVRAEAAHSPSPAAVLRRLNSELLAQHSDRFLTSVCATFSVTSGNVTGLICAGGHPLGLIRRADGRVEEAVRPGELLGTAPDVRLTDQRFDLAPGDVLLLYNDGATEARGRQDAASGRPVPGDSPLAGLLAGCQDLDAQGIVSCLAAAVTEHALDWAGDDAAFLAVRVPA